MSFLPGFPPPLFGSPSARPPPLFFWTSRLYCSFSSPPYPLIEVSFSPPEMAPSLCGGGPPVKTLGFPVGFSRFSSQHPFSGPSGEIPPCQQNSPSLYPNPPELGHIPPRFSSSMLSPPSATHSQLFNPFSFPYNPPKKCPPFSNLPFLPHRSFP